MIEDSLLAFSQSANQLKISRVRFLFSERITLKFQVYTCSHFAATCLTTRGQTSTFTAATIWLHALIHSVTKKRLSEVKLNVTETAESW